MTAWDQWEEKSEISGNVQRGWKKKCRFESVAFQATEDLGKLVGYMMTYGCHGDGQKRISIRFTNTRQEYLDEIDCLAKAVTGVTGKYYGDDKNNLWFTAMPRVRAGECRDCGGVVLARSHRVTGAGYGRCMACTQIRENESYYGNTRRRTNRMVDLIRVLSWDHGFPRVLFSLPRAVIGAAINRAWSGDGCVRVQKNRKGLLYPEVFLACENEIYARYFQVLLAKFGIRSRVCREWGIKSTKYFYRLVVGGGKENTERFFGLTGPIFGKEKRSEQAVVCGRNGERNRVIDYYKNDHNGTDGEAFHLARIIKIEDVGERPTFDITVPRKGWIVAGGIKAHNSGELFRDKVMRLYEANNRPLRAGRETALQLELSNGSRIVSLPGEEGTIRGYSGVSLLIIDEAARVSDALYYSVRPMLAVSQGRLVCLSTPFGKRGWFYDEWTGSSKWKRIKTVAEQCPRITKEFLDGEKLALGERWFAQEYGCSFEEMIGAVFSSGDIQAAMSDDVQPLFIPGMQ